MPRAVRAFAGAYFNAISLCTPGQNCLLEQKLCPCVRCKYKLRADALLWKKITGVGLMDRHIALQRNKNREALADRAPFQHLKWNRMLFRSYDGAPHQFTVPGTDVQSTRNMQ